MSEAREDTQETGGSLLRDRLLSGGAWAFGARIGVALTGLGANALLARLLSPEDFGTLFLALSVSSLLSLLALLGLETTVTRLVAESWGMERPGRVRAVVLRVVVLGTLGAVGVATAYLLFGGSLVAELFSAPALAAVTGLVAAWILMTTFQTLLAGIFRGFHDIRLFSVFYRSNAGFGSLASGTMLIAALGLLWLLGGQTNLSTVILLIVGSGLVSALLAVWLLVRKVGSLPHDESAGKEVAYGQVLNITWPLLVNNLALFALTQVDIWIVGAFLPQGQVALYGSALRLATLVLMPLLIVNAVAPPLIAEHYTRGERERLQKLLRATATVAGVPSLLVVGAFLFWGGPILATVFGGYYREGAIILAILSLGQLVHVLGGSCGPTMAMTGHQRLMMTITLISGAATVAGGLLAVSYYGAVGVAVAAAAGMALDRISMWLAARFATGLWTHMSIKAIPTAIKTLRKGF